MSSKINIGFFNNLQYDFANIYISEHLICFTQPKVGSRVLDELYNYDCRFYANLSIEKSKLYWKHIGMPDEIYDKEKVVAARKILNNILLGIEKRDIILFYRNPLDRYVSGLYQDLLTYYEDESEETKWLKNLGLNSGVSDEKLSEEFKQKLIPIIDNYISERVLSTAEDWGHVVNYLNGYLNLIYRSKMTQGSRVFLFNIENRNMNDILKNYTDTSQLGEIHKGKINFSNPYLKKLVEEEFYNQHGDIHDATKAKLKHEMSTYQILRSSSLNYKI